MEGYRARRIAELEEQVVQLTAEKERSEALRKAQADEMQHLRESVTDLRASLVDLRMSVDGLRTSELNVVASDSAVVEEAVPPTGGLSSAANAAVTSAVIAAAKAAASSAARHFERDFPSPPQAIDEEASVHFSGGDAEYRGNNDDPHRFDAEEETLKSVTHQLVHRDSIIVTRK